MMIKFQVYCLKCSRLFNLLFCVGLFNMFNLVHIFGKTKCMRSVGKMLFAYVFTFHIVWNYLFLPKTDCIKHKYKWLPHKICEIPQGGGNGSTMKEFQGEALTVLPWKLWWRMMFYVTPPLDEHQPVVRSHCTTRVRTAPNKSKLEFHVNPFLLPELFEYRTGIWTVK